MVLQLPGKLFSFECKSAFRMPSDRIERPYWAGSCRSLRTARMSASLMEAVDAEGRRLGTCQDRSVLAGSKFK